MLQSNQVLSFFRASERGDWNQRELAEFYRVEDALTKSGVAISTDRGLTDEGEPWFVFCRQDDEEVIVHFARIGGEYVVASNFTEAVFRRPKLPDAGAGVAGFPSVCFAAFVAVDRFSASCRIVGRLGGHGLRQEQ